MFSRVGAYRRVWRLRARIRKEKSPIPSAQTRDKRKEGRGEAITSRNEPRVPREKEEKEKARERERERTFRGATERSGDQLSVRTANRPDSARDPLVSPASLQAGNWNSTRPECRLSFSPSVFVSERQK